MARYVLDPRAFWLTLLDQPGDSDWGQLGQAWRQGKVTLCLSPSVMAMYVGPVQGSEADTLGLSETVLGKIGWLLRHQAEWFQPEPGPEVLGQPWDRLVWLVAAAKPDALLVADGKVTEWPSSLGTPVLTSPPSQAKA